jgi:hypothetical protein
MGHFILLTSPGFTEQLTLMRVKTEEYRARNVLLPVSFKRHSADPKHMWIKLQKELFMNVFIQC